MPAVGLARFVVCILFFTAVLESCLVVFPRVFHEQTGDYQTKNSNSNNNDSPLVKSETRASQLIKDKNIQSATSPRALATRQFIRFHTRLDDITPGVSMTNSTKGDRIIKQLQIIQKRKQLQIIQERKSKLLKKHKEPKITWVNLPRDVNATKESRIIYYLHLHKAGGTTMCYAAKANNMQTSIKYNCNLGFRVKCCGGNDTIEAQRQFAQRTKYTFVANEEDMYTGMDTESYRYTMMLRNSQSRYYSHYQHALRHRNISRSFDDWWAKQPDNWTTRKICGTACMNVTKYNLSRDLFEYTLNRLSKFESILFLETFNTSFTKFAHQVGWTKLPVFPESGHAAKYRPTTTNTTWDPLMTALDDALLEYAQLLDQGQTLVNFTNERRAFLDDYFTHGPARGCNNLCCAPACSEY